VIKLGVGYLREGGDWPDEAFTPTRLGEPTVLVRLAREVPNGFAPWADEDERPRWAMSEVRIARRWLAGSHSEDAATVAALEAQMPFAGPDVVTVPMRFGVEGWTGRAIATHRGGRTPRAVSVRVTYSPSRGLAVTEGA
jgi:CRISPR-associated endonuclease/helicase Cas3